MRGYSVTEYEITVQRTGEHRIDYTVTAFEPWSLTGPVRVRRFFANRAATFDADNGRQVTGAAWTLWRADDVELARAFQRQYQPRNLQITA